jgi:hypothetical protein
MLGTSLLSSIRADQGRTGTVAATGVAAVGSGTDGDCALWSDDVGDFVIILDPGGSGAYRDSRRYRERRGVEHQWRLRFVVGPCREPWLLSSIRVDQGRAVTVAEFALRPRDESFKQAFGNN